MEPFQFADEQWTQDDWRKFLGILVEKRLFDWKDVTTLTLGHLNPSQVGTALASSKGFKDRYGKGSTMRIVMSWFYEQKGVCADCGSRLELQADHQRPKQYFENPLDADFIENMVLRCRRCNVVKRDSHKFGGQTHLTAEAALMWILFTYRPRTLNDFVRLCRLYGMTMADIRMQEGWAMAHWLQHAGTFDYELDCPDRENRIFRWEDNALTRAWAGEVIEGAELLFEGVPPTDHLWFVAAEGGAGDLYRVTGYRMPVQRLPFSHYFRGEPYAPQSLAIKYRGPKRDGSDADAIRYEPLPPRGMRLVGVGTCKPGDELVLRVDTKSITLGPSNRQRRVAHVRATALDELQVTSVATTSTTVVPSENEDDLDLDL